MFQSSIQENVNLGLYLNYLPKIISTDFFNKDVISESAACKTTLAITNVCAHSLKTHTHTPLLPELDKDWEVVHHVKEAPLP